MREPAAVGYARYRAVIVGNRSSGVDDNVVGNLQVTTAAEKKCTAGNIYKQIPVSSASLRAIRSSVSKVSCREAFSKSAGGIK